MDPRILTPWEQDDDYDLDLLAMFDPFPEGFTGQCDQGPCGDDPDCPCQKREGKHEET